MSKLKMVFARGFVAAILSVSSALLSAATLAPSQSVFNWTGNCVDCAFAAESSNFPVSGILILNNYTLGDLIGGDNFYSFTYNGSNLINPFKVASYIESDDAFAGLFALGFVTGQIGSANQADQSLNLSFGDGLFFRSNAGVWSACAPSGTSYYGANNCFELSPADFGAKGQFSADTPAVPLPGTLWLFGLGAGLLLRTQGRVRSA